MRSGLQQLDFSKFLGEIYPRIPACTHPSKILPTALYCENNMKTWGVNFFCLVQEQHTIRILGMGAGVSGKSLFGSSRLLGDLQFWFEIIKALFSVYNFIVK